MNDTAIQDIYSDRASYCYGCGRLNEKGLKIKSYWDEGQGVCRCRVSPRLEHVSMPGFVYGGLIASVIDCHAMATAAAAYGAGTEHATDTRRKTDSGVQSDLRFVTRSLQVDYLKPTPMGIELELVARVEEMTDRKAIVAVELSARGVVCATGKVVAVKTPPHML